jgi:hypothetical protein
MKILVLKNQFKNYNVDGVERIERDGIVYYHVKVGLEMESKCSVLCKW